MLDLYVEFRNLTNGLWTPLGNELLGALAHYGLPGVDAVHKESMRELAIRGGPYTDRERRDLHAYCETDVDALERLLPRMLPAIDLPRAIALRGRYMKAAAAIERNGTPIDVSSLTTLRDRWAGIQDRLIEVVDADFGVYDGRTFKVDRFIGYLQRYGISWPFHPSGRPDLQDDTFKSMARVHPEIEPLRQLRHSLGAMRLHSLAVGRDGRNRCMLSAFKARTGRNQPSNARFIFGPAAWMRSLIRPEPGRVLVYCDWSGQEVGIAAALSGDPTMQAGYRSGDTYLAFAKLAGAIPPHGTKESHPAIRSQFKECTLAVQYGMGEAGLACRINQPRPRARELLELHHRLFPVFWRWSDAVEAQAMGRGELQAVFGWTIHVGPDANPRSLRNFPMQANGAEMMRLAACLLIEHGFRVCAPVHDAFLVELDEDRFHEQKAAVAELMAQASEIVLAGFRLRSDAQVIRWPSRYVDPNRGARMWNRVWHVIAELDPSIEPPLVAERGGRADPPAAVLEAV